MNQVKTTGAPALLRNPAGPAPIRARGSIRRTSSIDVSWPDGRSGDMRLVGRARDAVTPRNGGAPIVLAEDSYEATLKPDRTIVAIAATPVRPALARLVGERGGGHLRWVLRDVVPDELTNATPLYLVLDDISGASLVANWAWVRWDPNWIGTVRAQMSEAEWEKAMKAREGVCIGFAPGSSGLDHATRQSTGMPGAAVPDLRNPDDPAGWHAFTEQAGKIGFRRARRIDVRIDDAIVIDAGFQDSATTPEGGRAAVHEYRLAVTADPKTMRVVSITPDPRILPLPECPSAVGSAARMVGAPLSELRDKVLAELKGTAGCTHLNDAMRALAEVPVLVERLRATLA